MRESTDHELKAYKEALKPRSSLLICLDPRINWHGQPTADGRSEIFGDQATRFCLGTKCLFNLPRRQATGMTNSLLHLARLDMPAPDYSTVSRR